MQVNKNMIFRSRSKGFTLIELVFVVLVLGILYSIASIAISGRLTYAKETALKHDLSALRKSIDDYYTDKKAYPATLQDLVDNKYLRGIPDDPLTKESNWTIIPSEKGNDVFDIKSNSSGTGTNGKEYKDW